MSDTQRTIEELAQRAYPYGFVTAVETDAAPPGLSEDMVRLISAKKNEPEFMREWRLRAYRHWLTMSREAGEPRWANLRYPAIDYQKIVYYAAPKKKVPARLEDVDPEILKSKGLVKNLRDGLKILGVGELPHALHVKAQKFSKSAVEKIQKAGGTIEVIA